MVRVHIDIDIDHPPEKVFEFISNFENNPLWQGGMVKCEFLTDGPLTVGSRYQQEARFMGRPVYSTFEVLEYEPNKRIKASSISGSFPITFTRWVEDKAGKARVQALIEGDASGFFKLASPLMRWMVNRSIQKDYKKLKALLEKT